MPLFLNVLVSHFSQLEVGKLQLRGQLYFHASFSARLAEAVRLNGGDEFALPSSAGAASDSGSSSSKSSTLSQGQGQGGQGKGQPPSKPSVDRPTDGKSKSKSMLLQESSRLSAAVGLRHQQQQQNPQRQTSTSAPSLAAVQSVPDLAVASQAWTKRFGWLGLNTSIAAVGSLAATSGSGDTSV